MQQLILAGSGSKEDDSANNPANNKDYMSGNIAGHTAMAVASTHATYAAATVAMTGGV